MFLFKFIIFIIHLSINSYLENYKTCIIKICILGLSFYSKIYISKKINKKFYIISNYLYFLSLVSVIMYEFLIFYH